MLRTKVHKVDKALLAQQDQLVLQVLLALLALPVLVQQELPVQPVLLEQQDQPAPLVLQA